MRALGTVQSVTGHIMCGFGALEMQSSYLMCAKNTLDFED